MKTGDTVWYLYRCSGNGLTYQQQATLLVLKAERAKIRRDDGREAWVKIKNLRPVN